MRWPWQRKEPELQFEPFDLSAWHQLLTSLPRQQYPTGRIEWLDDVVFPCIEGPLWGDWRWVD